MFEAGLQGDAERRTDSRRTSGWKEPNAMEKLVHGAKIAN